MSKEIRPLNQLKQLLAKYDAQMAGIAKRRAQTGAPKIKPPPPQKRMRKP
jgi:hypothetical protein